MNKLLLTVMLGGTLLMTAGATTAASDDTARESQVASHSVGEAEAGRAVIRVTRAARVAGGACDVAIFVDGAEVAKLASGESAQFTVPAGKREVKARYALGDFCPASVRRVTVDATEGRTAQLLYNFAHSDRTTFRQVQ